MEKFEFKSQVATSVEQSKRLLELGLKKETADMIYERNVQYPYDYYLPRSLSEWEEFITGVEYDDIPAWSLHRLLMMYGDNYSFFSLDNAYGELVHSIAIDIEDGTFNQDYLEEKK